MRHIPLDERPIRYDRWIDRLPRWLQRFLPKGGGTAKDHHGKGMFGVTVFLLSESVVFLSLIFAYSALKATTADWLPAGVKGPEVSTFVVINTVVLLSSSAVIQLAERAIKKERLTRFRLLWSLTVLMGSYFLVGQAIEWSQAEFGLRTSIGSSAFYVLTGFHGLHVLVGVLLQLTMLGRSLIPHNYDDGHFGINATTLFWHFVDALWVVLFTIIYVW
ncbi:cytochrome c oxidase subunit 3 [Nodosilinea nodulosa]|uniref:cytochrome c oxidase subunit 3 n=1 Tax=Nodosilinea nodulosa TaxID=416001 RepID=UPI0002D2D4DC|nr:heme-copper oxidase subunit III [Nodosilinea nodulosa]